MKRADAQKAIDEAFAAGLKMLYERLVSNIGEQTPEIAVREFTEGLSRRDEAHSLAMGVVDKIFPE
jgi:hypothetical protein